MKQKRATARCVSVSSARARSKKMSLGVGHQLRAMGRLDHAAVEVLVLEHAERADHREYGEYAEVSKHDVSKCRACLSRRLQDGLRGAAAIFVTLELCEELSEPLLFSSNAERERERDGERKGKRGRERERIGKTSK